MSTIIIQENDPRLEYAKPDSYYECMDTEESEETGIYYQERYVNHYEYNYIDTTKITGVIFLATIACGLRFIYLLENLPNEHWDLD